MNFQAGEILGFLLDAQFLGQKLKSPDILITCIYAN